MKSKSKVDSSQTRTPLRQVNMIDMMFAAKRKPEMQVRQELPLREDRLKLNNTTNPGEYNKQ